jgi:Tol biopolymer transport system component
MTRTIAPLLAFASTLAACSAPEPSSTSAAQSLAPAHPATPIAVSRAADDLIHAGEKHFAHLWQITANVDNAAEGYWSSGGDRLCWQGMPRGTGCDRIFVTESGAHSGEAPKQISNGRGVTTCSYFFPGDKRLLYASTHAYQSDCPPRPDMSHGYVWSVHPEYDIYVRDLDTGRESALTSNWGYDAEATISPVGDKIVFTSSRSGDLELWTCDLDGSHLFQVTHAPGYDGGAFFSHDGMWLVFRATAFTAGKEAEEEAAYFTLLADWKVRPTSMEIMLIRPDGSERKQVTHLGKASFAPYFFPNDKRIIFASNCLDPNPGGRNFDLFAIDLDGKNLEPITTYEEFDSFPMFSPDGKWLVFASNRGGSHPHETNLFLAEWR